jgi:5-methylcytosine-specific restriction endonuclease McrA
MSGEIAPIRGSLKRCAGCAEVKPIEVFALKAGKRYRRCSACHTPHTRGKGHDWWRTTEGKQEARRLRAVRQGRNFRPGVPGRESQALDRAAIDQMRLAAILLCAAMLINDPVTDLRWHEAAADRRRARMIASKQARRGRERSQSDGTLTTDVVQAMFAAAELCAHCGCSLTFKRGRRTYLPTDATLDHVVPLSKGGLHGISNVVIACAGCNFGRHNRMLPTPGPPPLGPRRANCACGGRER